MGEVAVVEAVQGEVVDTDAIEIGRLYERSNSSLADAVVARLECGHRLIAKKKEVGHGAWLPWLQENAGVLGFDTDRTAQKLIKAARANPTLKSDLAEPEAATLSRQMWGNSTTRGTTGTGENEWYTPDIYLDAVRAMFGSEIELDPASSEAAQETVQANTFFSLEEDGLSQEWFGKVWLNPPYSQPDIAHFISKLVKEVWSGNVEEAILLTHNYTDTAWFHEAAQAASAICFTRGRIKFYDKDGKEAAPTQGQAFSYFGQRIEDFHNHFSQFGFIVEVRK